MNRRHLRLLPAVLIASAVTVGATSPAVAHRGEAAAVAKSASKLRVGPNFGLLPTPDPIYGRDAVGLAVNPEDSQHIVAIYSDYTTLWCEVAVTFDGGQKWRRTRLKAPGGFIQPPCTVGSHLANFIDGGIAFGRDNRVYATFASGIVDEQGDSRGKSVLVATSTNGGRSFGVGTIVLQGGADAELGPDHTLPKLAVRVGTGDRLDRIHVVANRSERLTATSPAQNSVVLTRSTNGGRDWAPPVIASQPGQSSIEASEPAIGRGNTLYVAWRTQKAAAQPGRFRPEGLVVVARSNDLGETWQRVPVAGVRGFIYAGPPQQLYGSTQQFTASTFPRLAADRRSGNVYIVYNSGEVPLTQANAIANADHFIHNNADVYFQRSTNGGRNWSDPWRMNSDAKIQLEVTQTRHPTLAVARNGRLDVVWQDRRHWYLGMPKREGSGTCTHTHTECDEARLGDTYYRYSTDGGASFSKDRRITDHSMNNDVGFDYRFGAYWDYGPRAMPIGNDRIMFAWMDSRDGNTETDNMGVYLAEATLGGETQKVPVRRINRSSASDLAVKLSQRAYQGGNEGVLAATFATRPWTRPVIVNERDFAGALAGGVLARAFLGPVLLTPRDGLTGDVKAEITRLAPVGAYVIGGEGSVSQQVVSDLAAVGTPADQITRIAGADAAGTAAAIAMAMDRRPAIQKTQGRPAFDAAVIVNQASPDAGAIATLAANRRLPVLLTNADSLPPATANAIAALNIKRTIVVGTSEYVNDSVLAALPQPDRIAGSNAVSTSRSIMSESKRWGLPTNVVYASRAARKMDAAVMGAAVARIGGLQLLSPGGGQSAERILGQKKMRSEVDHLVMAD